MGLFDAFQDPQFRKDLKKNAGDFAQSASNTAASNMYMPVDAINWILGQNGIKIDDPVMGEDWMRRVGLLRQVDSGVPKMAGETFGLLAMLPFAKPKK